jgi:hypothetical protein
MKRKTVKQIVFATTSSLVLAGIIFSMPPFVKTATTTVASSVVATSTAPIAKMPLALPKFSNGDSEGAGD